MSTATLSTVNAGVANTDAVNAGTAKAGVANASAANASTVNASAGNTDAVNASTVNAGVVNASAANTGAVDAGAGNTDAVDAGAVNMRAATTGAALTSAVGLTWAALETAPAVGLAELDAAAALQTRVDRKYVLTVAEARRLLAALAPAARVLEIDGLRDFRYASTYFDTPDLETYRLAAYRRRRRYKVRTRTYLDSGTCFLEVKTRAARGVTVKHRTVHDQAAALGRGGGFVADRLTAAGVVGVDPERLAPALASRYQRTTLLLPDARLTVDTGLVWTLLTPGRTVPAEATLAGVVIVETKTGSAPSSADRLLWQARHRPDRISKYATGVAVLRGDLPDTRWRRTLRRHPAAFLHDERTVP